MVNLFFSSSLTTFFINYSTFFMYYLESPKTALCINSLNSTIDLFLLLISIYFLHILLFFFLLAIIYSFVLLIPNYISTYFVLFNIISYGLCLITSCPTTKRYYSSANYLGLFIDYVAPATFALERARWGNNY